MGLWRSACGDCFSLFFGVRKAHISWYIIFFCFVPLNFHLMSCLVGFLLEYLFYQFYDSLIRYSSCLTSIRPFHAYILLLYSLWNTKYKQRTKLLINNFSKVIVDFFYSFVAYNINNCLVYVLNIMDDFSSFFNPSVRRNRSSQNFGFFLFVNRCPELTNVLSSNYNAYKTYFK